MADERDDKIAALELQLEAASQQLAESRQQVQQAGALFGDVEQLKAANKELDDKLKEAKRIEADLRGAMATTDKASVSGLPDNALQLGRTVKVSDAALSTKDRDVSVEAKDGDILLVGDAKALKALQLKVGSAAKCYTVDAATLAEIKREGWHRK
jgi:hypothetical protein